MSTSAAQEGPVIESSRGSGKSHGRGEGRTRSRSSRSLSPKSEGEPEERDSRNSPEVPIISEPKAITVLNILNEIGREYEEPELKLDEMQQHLPDFQDQSALK
ncbi:hypothetical protein TWF696_001843 [Orbilia brochopaga]|uniref:Uncharacterized protein n=1 Tax=Orbilia brochopaga TaxID=3140254 RepID=A0AAV9U8A7_9PEZI